MGRDWIQVALRDVSSCRNGAGIRQEYFSDHGTPLVRVSDFDRDSIDVSSCIMVDSRHAEQWPHHRLSTGEVLVATVGSWPPNWSSVVGKAVRVPPSAEGYIQNQNTACITADRALADQNFLFYILRTKDFIHYAANSAHGSASQARLSVENLANYRFPMPGLSEQRAIASILGALDDKIELNRRMNQTLESIARAVFKSWFVDFDPVRAKAEGRQPAGMDAETATLFPTGFVHASSAPFPAGWSISCLDDLRAFALGGDWGSDNSSEEYSEAAACIRGADIPSLQAGGVGAMPIRYLKPPSIEKRALCPGDVVVEISGGSPTQSTGRPVLISDALLRRLNVPLVCSNFCRMVRLRSGVAPSFLYLWMRYLYDCDAFVEYENGTTGIKNFSFTVFSQTHEVVVPDSLIMSRFGSMIEPLFARRDANGRECDILSLLRDALLPKLLSGEIRVREAEKLVEAHV